MHCTSATYKLGTRCQRRTTNSTDGEWQLIEYCFPKPSKKGRRREHGFRELLNTIFDVVKSGGQWRKMRSDFAPWDTAYRYLRLWKRNGLWFRIHTHSLEHVRLLLGRNRPPTEAILDSPSVKSTETSDKRGYDAGNCVVTTENGAAKRFVIDPIGVRSMVREYDGAGRLLLPRC